MKPHPPWLNLVTLLAVLLTGRATSAAETATNAFTFNDFLLVPLRFHLLSAKDAPQLATTLTESDITRILGKMNGIWAQAGVHFYRESLIHEEAEQQDLYREPLKQPGLEWLLALRRLATTRGRWFDLYYLNQMKVNGVYFSDGIFVKDTASLRSVDGGIDEPLPRVSSHEPLPRVSSHELGHAFSLPHRQAVTNLMASGTTGTVLNAVEIAQARAAARKFDWIETAPAILKQADDLFRAKKTKEARAFYERLATLPLKTGAVEKARKRAGH